MNESYDMEDKKERGQIRRI